MQSSRGRGGGKFNSFFPVLGKIWGGRGGVKNFFPHPNQLSIWAYPENLVKIRLLVQALDEFCGTGREGEGRAGHRA